MDSFESELDFEVDLDDIINNQSFDAIINDNSIDDFLNNDKLKTAIEEVGVGSNDDYERQIIEQKKKREEYLKYKEQRRQESKEERLRSVLIEKRQLEEQLKSDQKSKEMAPRVTSKPKIQKSKPLETIDTNVTFNRKVSKERPSKRMALNSDTIINPIAINKKLKTKPMDTQNKNFGFTTVLIKNLAPETNEYIINNLGQCIGKVLGVCIALEEGIRKAMVRFESPVDALLFQRKFNDYKLDSTNIRTSLIP